MAHRPSYIDLCRSCSVRSLINLCYPNFNYFRVNRKVARINAILQKLILLMVPYLILAFDNLCYWLWNTVSWYWCKTTHEFLASMYVYVRLCADIGQIRHLHIAITCFWEDFPMISLITIKVYVTSLRIQWNWKIVWFVFKAEFEPHVIHLCSDWRKSFCCIM